MWNLGLIYVSPFQILRQPSRLAILSTFICVFYEKENHDYKKPSPPSHPCRAAGRTARRQDDALWERFHAAQQVFFKARQEKDAKENAELTANLKVKEELAAQAEALLPIKDIKAAKRALRPIQDRWEAVGYVPRNAMRRIEGRMRAVEEAIREAERNEWRRTDPETKARAEGLAGQLEASIADLEAKLEKAKAEGKAKAIAEHEAALNARRAWLDQVRRSTKA